MRHRRLRSNRWEWTVIADSKIPGLRSIIDSKMGRPATLMATGLNVGSPTMGIVLGGNRVEAGRSVIGALARCRATHLPNNQNEKKKPLRNFHSLLPSKKNSLRKASATRLHFDAPCYAAIKRPVDWIVEIFRVTSPSSSPVGGSGGSGMIKRY